MKKSQLRNLIREEISTIIKEQEASDAMTAIENIKAAVKELSGSSIAQEDAVLQKLMAKYTGLLGKITSYIKTKYQVSDEPKETDSEKSPDESNAAVPKPKAQTPPPAKGPQTSVAGAPDYSKTV